MGIIADILRRHGPAYLDAAGAAVPLSQRRAARRITACRTGSLGGHVEYCADCSELLEFTPHSCRDRLCPVCRGAEAHAWLEARRAELLPVRYFHVIVTVPTAYSRAVRDHPARLGGELMAAVAEALQTLAANPTQLGGELGILAVLHTWGRKLNWHAHVHCLVPGVALHSDGSLAVVGTHFLVPVGAFRKVFPAILTRRFRAALPGFDPPGRVWRTPWNVLIRPCDEGPRVVLNYLTRYVRSGPLHEAQILRADDDEVAFRYLDHRSGKVEILPCTPAGFVARYLQHALPPRFHRIRHYGFLAPGRRRDLHALQIALIARYGPSALAPELPHPAAVAEPQPCPYCGSIRPRHRGTIPPCRPGVTYAVTWRAPPLLVS
jgi:hypothetical protein